MQKINVYKNRVTKLPVSLGYDVSQDTITSEIRTGKSLDSDLIATWNVSFITDGTDGELLLTIDVSESSAIEEDSGYMDLKRVTEGSPISVFNEPLNVVFQEVVTA